MFDKKQLEAELVLAGITRSNFAKDLGMNTSNTVIFVRRRRQYPRY